MNPKDQEQNLKTYLIGEEAIECAVEGVSEYATAMKGLLGPLAKLTLIPTVMQNPQNGETRTHIEMTRDGVTASDKFVTDNVHKNRFITVAREASSAAVQGTADATTTSAVLTGHILKTAYEYTKANGGKTGVMRKAIKSSVAKVLDVLEKMKEECSPEQAVQVATISANNNPVLGKLVADACLTAGKDGVINISFSNTAETYTDVKQGYLVETGMQFDSFRTGASGAVLTAPYVFVSRGVLESQAQFKAIYDAFRKLSGSETTGLVIVAPEIKSSFLQSLLASNQQLGGTKFLYVQAPEHAGRQDARLTDLSLYVGCTAFDHVTNARAFERIDGKNFGKCEEVTSGIGSTFFTKGNGNPDAVQKEIQNLTAMRDGLDKDSDGWRQLNLRVERLGGTMVTIYAGAATNGNKMEVFRAIQDAVGATNAAVSNGIVAGGGCALMYAANNVYDENATKEENVITGCLSVIFNTIAAKRLRMKRNLKK